MQVVSAAEVAQYLTWQGVIDRLRHTFVNG